MGETAFFVMLPIVAGVSLATTALLWWGFSWLFRRIGWLDCPERYEHERHRKAVPYGMGVIFFAVLATTLGIWYAYTGEWSPKLTVILAIAWGMTALSFLDDLDTIGKLPIRISPIVRLVFQVLAGVAIGMTSIKIGYVSGLFGGIVHLDQYSITALGYEIFFIPILFTVAWYVLVFNAVNWSDGLPGLTGSFSLVAFLVIAVLTTRLYLVDATEAARENSRLVFLLLATVLPPLLLIGWADMKRKLLMGDTGTMFLAFMLATLAIVAGGKVATVATVLGVYLVDAFYVILVRIYKGQNPLKGDRIHHLHHRLLAEGVPAGFIRMFVSGVAFLFGMAAVFLDRVGKLILFALLVVVVVGASRIIPFIRR